ncbi:MAG: hypothetical protein RL763_527 [Pseudomonadota bacterium]
MHIDPSRVQVAVGVLIRPDGYFLLTTRPAGKDYAGYWEFPGGKLEQGETVAQALTRELREELGIEVTQCLAWQSECIDYPHALVQLHFYKVLAWQGELEFAWEQLPVQVVPVLPGTVPVLEWLAQAQSSISNSAFSFEACGLPSQFWLISLTQTIILLPLISGTKPKAGLMKTRIN